MKISEKLKIIINISNLTQEKLSQELGVSFATLNSWINERSIPHKKKQTVIDEYYKKCTGQKMIPYAVLQAKKELVYKQGKKYKNIIKEIARRQDVYDQFVLSLTYNSNRIEGSTLTEDETADILFRNINIKKKSLIENLEAKNHQTAFDYLFREIKLNFDITENFILKLHSILMNGIRDDAGMYRRHGVRIIGSNIPTANYVKVPLLMIDMINDISNQKQDLLSHATMVHSKFEKIHPFSDGNGRIGRLIMTAMLLRGNLAPAIIRQEIKNLYYKYLQKSQLENDFSLLEDFICDSVFEGYKIIND